MREKQKRTSRQEVQRLANVMGMELLFIEDLGDRKDYWYKYWVVDAKTRETIVPMTESLKEVKQKLWEILDERIGCFRAELT